MSSLGPSALREVETSAPQRRRAFVSLYDHPVNRPLRNVVASDTTARSRLMILRAPGQACQLHGHVREAPRPEAWAGVAGPQAPHTHPGAPPRGRLGFPAAGQSQGSRGLRRAPAQPACRPRAGTRCGRGAAGCVALLFLLDTRPRPPPPPRLHPILEPPGRPGGLEGGGAGGHSPPSAALRKASSLQAPCFPWWGG